MDPILLFTGSYKGWFIGVIPSSPAEHQQVLRWAQLGANELTHGAFSGSPSNVSGVKSLAGWFHSLELAMRRPGCFQCHQGLLEGLPNLCLRLPRKPLLLLLTMPGPCVLACCLGKWEPHSSGPLWNVLGLVCVCEPVFLFLWPLLVTRFRTSFLGVTWSPYIALCPCWT